MNTVKITVLIEMDDDEVTVKETGGLWARLWADYIHDEVLNDAFYTGLPVERVVVRSELLEQEKQ